MTDCDRVLNALRSGPKTAAELYQLHCIVHSRIADLRAKGYEISCTRVPGSIGARSYKYELITEPLSGASAAAVAPESGPAPVAAPSVPGPLDTEGQLTVFDALVAA